MTTTQWVGVSVAILLLSGFMPPAATGQTPSGAASARQTFSTPAEPGAAPAPDAVYAGAAVVATGANIAVRELLCSVGNIVGFFTLAVIRLPVWAVTLGDRVGSSEPLDRLGNAIVEKACEGPWIVTTEQVKALEQAPSAQGPSIGEPVAVKKLAAEGP